MRVIRTYTVTIDQESEDAFGEDLDDFNQRETLAKEIVNQIEGGEEDPLYCYLTNLKNHPYIWTTEAWASENLEAVQFIGPIHYSWEMSEEVEL